MFQLVLYGFRVRDPKDTTIIITRRQSPLLYIVALPSSSSRISSLFFGTIFAVLEGCPNGPTVSTSRPLPATCLPPCRDQGFGLARVSLFFQAGRQLIHYWLTMAVTVCSRSLEKAALKESLKKLIVPQPRPDLPSEESQRSVTLRRGANLLREVRVGFVVVQQAISYPEPEPEQFMYDKMMARRAS